MFVTNLRAQTIARLRLDVDSVRADNPSVIYVRGSAFGPKGPDADRGGYDAGAYWARSGMQQIFTRPGDENPASPRPAFGDVVGGATIAGAISTALYHRAVHGEASTIDVALLAAGMWQIQTDVASSMLTTPEQRAAHGGRDGRLRSSGDAEPAHGVVHARATTGSSRCRCCRPSATGPRSATRSANPRWRPIRASPTSRRVREHAAECTDWLDGHLRCSRLRRVVQGAHRVRGRVGAGAAPRRARRRPAGDRQRLPRARRPR